MAFYSTPRLHPEDEAFLRFNESAYDSFVGGVKSGYANQMAKEDAAYAKYADIAKQALNKSQDFAKFMEEKTGISPILAITLTAAGITGGASAIPMSALMYFARKYYTKGLSTAVSYGVDKAFDAVAGKQQPQLQPESFSFREWLMTEEEKEGWVDYLARHAGYGVGAIGGAVASLVKNVYNTVASRMKELKDYIAQNPRQITKIALTIGLAAATGGVVGKVSKDIVNAVGDKIKGLLPDTNDLAHIQQQIEPEAGSGDFEGGYASSGEFDDNTPTATADQMKHGGETLINKDMDSFRARMRAPTPPTTADDLLKDIERSNAEYEAKLAAMTPHEKLLHKIALVRKAQGDELDSATAEKIINKFMAQAKGDELDDIQKAVDQFAYPKNIGPKFSSDNPEIDAILKDAQREINNKSDEIIKQVDQFAAPEVPDKWSRLKKIANRFSNPQQPASGGVWSNPDPEVDSALKQAQQGIADKAAKTGASMKAAERFIK